MWPRDISANYKLLSPIHTVFNPCARTLSRLVLHRPVEPAAITKQVKMAGTADLTNRLTNSLSWLAPTRRRPWLHRS
jgi:hypothetical protein